VLRPSPRPTSLLPSSRTGNDPRAARDNKHPLRSTNLRQFWLFDGNRFCNGPDAAVPWLAPGHPCTFATRRLDVQTMTLVMANPAMNDL